MRPAYGSSCFPLTAPHAEPRKHAHKLLMAYMPQINKVETPLVLQVGEDSKCLLEGGGVEPSPAQLAGLSLRSGFNAGIFVVQEFVGEKWEDRKEIPVGFFLWDSSDRVVVMDVEGTVVQGDVWSKSADVLLLSANKQHTASGVGMETVRDGVAPLLSYLDRAGYRVLFLTAVPLTRAGRVRETLNWIRASERATWGRGAEVPASPVLTTRERMGTVLMRKLADKAVATVGGGATQQATFKAEALAQVRALFDDGAARRAPFAGGVVGKGDDARAYVEAGGMPAESVFVLDAKGRVESSCPAHDSLVWASYVEMCVAGLTGPAPCLGRARCVSLTWGRPSQVRRSTKGVPESAALVARLGGGGRGAGAVNVPRRVRPASRSTRLTRAAFIHSCPRSPVTCTCRAWRAARRPACPWSRAAPSPRLAAALHAPRRPRAATRRASQRRRAAALAAGRAARPCSRRRAASRPARPARAAPTAAAPARPHRWRARAQPARASTRRAWSDSAPQRLLLKASAWG